MRKFNHHTTWEDVSDMTVEEAISVLSRFADSDGRDWSARPHLAKTCQMAIHQLKEHTQNHIEVVRCKECSKRNTEACFRVWSEGDPLTGEVCISEYYEPDNADEWFCADGKRA